jgi:GrpB-like predicted nucleotidyltransferase (UPF0157 family)
MRIFRFDEELSIPIDAFGSNFRIGPLTGDAATSKVRVQMMYLPAGGGIGCHPTPVQQLFAVVAGTGWVAGGGSGAGTGDDDDEQDRRDIRPGYAALWDAGEDHEAGTAHGLTAICIEGRFDVWATAVTTDIVVTDYDPAWPDWFETLRQRIWPAVEGIAICIDHVGSTSVPGLAAKPIIDMDIVVADPANLRPVIQRLATIGYRWRGDLGVVGREAFALPKDGTWPAHNLYLVVEDNKAHLDHWLLRDLLRRDAGARARYARLKRANVDVANRDMDIYLAAKAGLVAELLDRARAERTEPDRDP